jgi:hypothetical protein
MSKPMVVLIVMIIGIGLVSGLLGYWRAKLLESIGISTNSPNSAMLRPSRHSKPYLSHPSHLSIFSAVSCPI